MTYEIKDIVQNDLCTGCGVCISESTSSKMVWNKYGFLVPELDNSFNETAIKVCPFSPQNQSEAKDEDHLADLFLENAKKSDKRIGKFENTYVGYSKNFRANSSSGGIATYIFEQLLKQNLVDHLFIVKEINGSYAYQWFNDVEQILQISKTRYIPVTLENLFIEIDKKQGKIAVSGVACFIKAIRLKQYYRPKYREKIPFLVGIICGGLKSSFFTDYLAQKAGIEGDFSKQHYRIKNQKSTADDYSFGAFDELDKLHELKMKSVGDMWGTGLFKANACDFCDDVTTELADISLGDAWLQPYRNDGNGTSVIITRTKLSDQLISDGIITGALNIENLSLDSLKKSQAGSFKHRQMAEAFRLRKLKKINSVIPYKRRRMLEQIPFEYQIVQVERMRLRQRSLEIWKDLRVAEKFDNAIINYKSNLEQKTKWYYLVQSLRNKLGLKKL